MNPAEVLRRMWKEKHEWEKMGTEPEIQWTLRGINLCIKHVKDIMKEQNANERIRKPFVHRWLAKELYHSVLQSLNYLQRGDRAKAISMLEKSKEYVQRRVA